MSRIKSAHWDEIEKGELDCNGISAVQNICKKNKEQLAMSNNYLDFDKVRSWLKRYKTAADVEAAKKELLMKFPKATAKQRAAIDRIFADYKDYLEYGDPFEAFGFKEVKEA